MSKADEYLEASYAFRDDNMHKEADEMFVEYQYIKEAGERYHHEQRPELGGWLEAIYGLIG